MSKTKIILFLLIAVYTIYFSAITIARHHTLYSGRFDLGNMEQTVWNTSRGRIFQMTNPDTSLNASRLAFHADFLLILITPIYMLFPFTETLLVIQALVVALGAIPVYLIAKRIFVGVRLQNKLPILFSILYLLSPILERANIYEFHSETLGVTFLLFTFYFLLKEKIKPFLLFFFLALISKETVSLVLATICFWGIIKNKHRALSIILFGFCLFYFLFMVKVAIPQANTATTYHFALRHFGEGDQSFNTLILGYIKNPLDLFKLLLSSTSLAYYVNILSTAGFFPLLCPLSFLFSLPPILINTLSKDSQFRVMDYQYQATIVPGLIISAIYGTKKIWLYGSKALWLKRSREARENHRTIEPFSHLIFFVIFITIVIYNLRQFSPLPFIGQSPYLDFLSPFVAVNKILYWENRVPFDKSVTVTNNAGAHFAKRQLLYHFPRKIGEVDYVIIAAKSWQEWVTDENRDKIIAELKKNPKYKLLDEGDGFWIFRKK